MTRASTTLRRAKVGNAVRQAAPSWIATRVLVAVGFVVATALADSPKPLTLEQGLLSWDADWYRSIADQGYEGAPDLAIRFFPALPLLGRWGSWLTGGRSDISLVVITSVVSLAAGAALFELARTELGDIVAGRAVWVFALFPTAFVLVAPYTESLLVFFTCVFALAIGQRRWPLALLAGLLAGLSRPVGGLLVVYAAIEFWPSRHVREALPQRLAVTASPALGVAAFGAWSALAGRGFTEPFDAQRGLRGSFQDPLTRWLQAVGNGVAGDETELLHALAAAVCVGLLVVLWRAGMHAFAVYGATGILIALSATNINSLVRYAHGLVPVLLGAAIAIGNPRVGRSMLRLLGALAAAAVVVFTSAILMQEYVP